MVVIRIIFCLFCLSSSFTPTDSEGDDERGEQDGPPQLGEEDDQPTWRGGIQKLSATYFCQEIAWISVF